MTTYQQVITFNERQLLAENQRLSDAVAAYHKMTERLQAEKVHVLERNAQLQKALDDVVFGFDMEMLGKGREKLQEGIINARAASGEKVSE